MWIFELIWLLIKCSLVIIPGLVIIILIFNSADTPESKKADEDFFNSLFGGKDEK